MKKIRRLKAPDGLIHTRPIETKAGQEHIPGMKDSEICLNCTLEKCYGTKKCVEKQKIKTQKEGAEK